LQSSGPRSPSSWRTEGTQSMNSTQVESAITSIIIAIGGWFVGKGWATAADVSAFATAITTIIGAIMVVLPFVRKIYNASSGAMIKTINSEDNGVKVVAASTPAPTAT